MSVNEVTAEVAKSGVPGKPQAMDVWVVYEWAYLFDCGFWQHVSTDEARCKKHAIDVLESMVRAGKHVRLVHVTEKPQ